MRPYFAISSVVCMLAGAMLIPLPASADWQNPYYHRETSGSWTNVEYNDGVCHFYYSHNAYDQNTKLNRYGDCSHVAIGPGGVATPVYAAPVVVRELPRR